jgi:hypothetical protein
VVIVVNCGFEAWTVRTPDIGLDPVKQCLHAFAFVFNLIVAREQFKNAVQERGYRITRYRQVSIFGLVGDSREDPFDTPGDRGSSPTQPLRRGPSGPQTLAWTQSSSASMPGGTA